LQVAVQLVDRKNSEFQTDGPATELSPICVLVLGTT